MKSIRPAGWAVINCSRGGIFIENHWYSDYAVALGAMNFWGRFVFPGEALTLFPLRRWPVPRPAWL
jgi:hypothetical protein